MFQLPRARFDASRNALIQRYAHPHQDGVVRFDFGGLTANDKALLDGDIEALEGVARIAGHDYDWSLNDSRDSGS